MILFECKQGICFRDISKDYTSNTVTRDLYQATKTIIYDELNASEAFELFEADRSLLPIMVHENYPAVISDDSSETTKSLQVVCDVLCSLSRADTIDKLMYTTQDWVLTPLIGLFGVLAPNIFLNRSSHRTSDRMAMKFTANLSKTSLHFNHGKNIETFLNEAARPGFSSDDLVTVIKISDFLMTRDTIQAVAFLRSYNLGYDDVKKIKKSMTCV